METSAQEREVRRRYGVPDGVRLRVLEHEVLAWLPGHEVDVRVVAARADALPPSGRGGRASLRRLASPEGPLLVRPYRKGGLLRRVRGASFLGAWRPLAELVLHRRLLALGVPVVEAVGCALRLGNLTWRGHLVLREVAGALDLEAWLHGVPAPAGQDARAVLAAAGRAVRRLHDAGVPHPDLHPKNLLLAPDGRVLVLDLDKARPRDGPLSEADRFQDLVRLGRAIEKHRLKGLRLGARTSLRFLEAYAGDAGAGRLWLERIRQRLRRDLWWRLIWWRMTGEARPWRAPAGVAS